MMGERCGVNVDVVTKLENRMLRWFDHREDGWKESDKESVPIERRWMAEVEEVDLDVRTKAKLLTCG